MTRIFHAIIVLIIAQTSCTSVLVYHLSPEICIKNDARIALGDFSVKSYFSGEEMSMLAKDFKQEVSIELSKRFYIVPKELFENKYNKVAEIEVEEKIENMRKNEEISDKNIEVLKEQIRYGFNEFELNIKTSKLVGARYMVSGFAYWDEKASVPLLRGVVLYLFEVETKTEMISVHHENIAQRDEIFSKLIPIFGQSIENRLCIKRY